MVERSADQRIRTSEWEDVQYKFGNRVGKYATSELQLMAQKIADSNADTCLKTYDANEEKVRDKLARGGYDEDNDDDEDADRREGDGQTLEKLVGKESSDDDDDALAAFRRKRMMELKAQQATQCFGTLRHIEKEDYVREITEASQKNWVVAVLMKPANDNCESLLAVMRTIAQRNRDVKFLTMISTEVVGRFPDSRLPCVLLYKDGELKRQVTELAPWIRRDRQISVESTERTLQEFGVIHRDEYVEDDDN